MIGSPVPGADKANVKVLGFLPLLALVVGSVVGSGIFNSPADLGGKMIREALADEAGERLRGDPTRGWSLVSLSVATSLDALAVGFSFAMLRIEVWYPSVIIGLVAAGMTLLGMHLGGRLGHRFGRAMEIAGGLVLIAIGTRILWQHLAP